ncbi:MAG: lipopolysaccharide assembly protein LapA domain-containing protein [Pseudomonadota bacterium]
MLRLIRLGLVIVLALILVVIAIANRDTVVVQLLPSDLSGIFALNFEVPLFVLMVILGGGGFALGFSWEYLREWSIRAEARRAKKAAQSLEREIKSMKAEQGVEEDDVLALLK